MSGGRSRAILAKARKRGKTARVGTTQVFFVFAGHFVALSILVFVFCAISKFHVFYLFFMSVVDFT